MANIELLKPKVKDLAQKLVSACTTAGTPITVIQTLRTIAEQDALYAEGRTTPGNIVTKAKGGYSLHNYGVAFDVCPVVNGKLIWNDTDLFKKVGALGQGLGLEWGGTWTSFVDLPHFQYLAGYTLTDFRTDKIDWKKFDLVAGPVATSSGSNTTIKNDLPRDLEKGMTGSDVTLLQKMLNADPTTRISSAGLGSPGKETNSFGELTRVAVGKFQLKWGIVGGSSPAFGRVGPKTRAKLLEIFGNTKF